MEASKRPATKDDVEFARRAHHLAYREVVVRQFGEWDEGRQDTFFDTGWTSAQHEILLCDGAPCGYVSVDEFPGYTHVRELVIHPEYQRRGIGTAFLRQVVQQAQARHVPVRLGVLRENRAVEFYRKLGFKEFDRTDTHILMERNAGPETTGSGLRPAREN